MISIICPSNNEKILNENLIKSLQKQNYKDFELIIVDTIKNKINSAIDALNYGVMKANYENLLFVHHDVIFYENDLQNIADWIKKIDDFGIIGVAGIKKQKGGILGNITDGKKNKKISKETIKEPENVFSLDEVLFIVKKKKLEKYPFDIKNKTWHLYAVEYCLKMKNKGEKVMVIPSNIYHLSDGQSLNNSYFRELRRICKENRKLDKVIYTTVGSWYTNPILLNMQIIKKKINTKIKG